MPKSRKYTAWAFLLFASILHTCESVNLHLKHSFLLSFDTTAGSENGEKSPRNQAGRTLNWINLTRRMISREVVASHFNPLAWALLCLHLQLISSRGGSVGSWQKMSLPSWRRSVMRPPPAPKQAKHHLKKTHKSKWIHNYKLECAMFRIIRGGVLTC